MGHAPFVLVVAGAAAIPLVVTNNYYLDSMIVIFFWGSMAAAWNLVGGYAGRWLTPEHLDVPLTVDALRAAGGTLGAGLVVALPVSACGLATTARLPAAVGRRTNMVR